MPSKRFDEDFYKKRKRIKSVDFMIGFLGTALLWIASFRLAWYAAPLIIFCVCMAGIFYKFHRRYIVYGALSLIFFPLVLWGALLVGFAGRNEIKS